MATKAITSLQKLFAFMDSCTKPREQKGLQRYITRLLVIVWVIPQFLPTESLHFSTGSNDWILNDWMVEVEAKLELEK